MAGSGGDAAVVRDLVREFDGKRFRLVTRLDRATPPLANVSTAHCLAFRGDDVVLVLHPTRGWTIPGGHLEPGETPAQAMVREAREEAGIVVTDAIVFAHEQVDLLDGATPDPRYPVPSFQLFFVARVNSIGPVASSGACEFESRLFSPHDARSASDWVQGNGPLFEAALALARERYSG